MHLIGRRATPDSIAAGIICRREPEEPEPPFPPLLAFPLAILDGILDANWAFCGRVLRWMFKVDLETRAVHTQDGFVSLLTACFFGLVALAFIVAVSIAFDLGVAFNAASPAGRAKVEWESRRR